MNDKTKSPVAEHPMDDFPVRPLNFELDKIRFSDPLWSRSCPDFSMFINALGLHVPYFERYLVKAMSAAKKQITDEALQRDVKAIIGQEAHHAKNFIGFNDVMAKRYPKVAALDKHVRESFGRQAREDDPKTLAGFTAGYETFTFITGLAVLDNYDEWMKHSDPVMKAIWVWHQVEEVEHGAVAFDVYKYLFGKHEWFRKWMVLKAGGHIGWETFKAYSHMAAVEYGWKRPFRYLSSMGFLFKTLGSFFIHSFPAFRASYHPKRHPLVTNKQNPVQVAWRHYEHDGGNVLEIDRTKMTEMLGLRKAA